MIEKVDRYWKAHLAEFCDLQWKPEVLNSDAGLMNLAGDLAHPAGSTRMGTNPSDSVVDPHLRVHRIDNLSVASASVFPSSGSANPTLTVMHLAMRAADAIAARMVPNEKPIYDLPVAHLDHRVPELNAFSG
jgi:choline dehydrogenase-like flavoprotein